VIFTNTNAVYLENRQYFDPIVTFYDTYLGDTKNLTSKIFECLN
jgi:hypothetical protein